MFTWTQLLESHIMKVCSFITICTVTYLGSRSGRPKLSHPLVYHVVVQQVIYMGKKLRQKGSYPPPHMPIILYLYPNLCSIQMHCCDKCELKAGGRSPDVNIEHPWVGCVELPLNNRGITRCWLCCYNNQINGRIIL